MKLKIVYIINPISGTSGKTKILREIRRKTDRNSIDIKIEKTKYAGHATEIAKNAAKDGANIVVAVGGDGTVNEVGRALVHTNTAMGIIPCGSGNGLARHLKIPMNPGKAIEIINYAHIEDMDYGIIENHPFFCTCGVGFDAHISQKFAEADGRGLVTYVENTVNSGLTYKPETYRIETPNGCIKCDAFLITCANASQYGNNAYIAPNASMRDGKMDITILKPFNVLEAPGLAIQLFSKTMNYNRHAETLKVNKIIIHREKDGPIHYDGDPMMGGKNLEIEIVHKGIKMVCPTDEMEQKEPLRGYYQLADLVENSPMMKAIIEAHNKFDKLNRNIIKQLTGDAKTNVDMSFEDFNKTKEKEKENEN